MAGGMKSLAKDTAIYGGSSIICKFFNYCLVPIYSRVLFTDEYGLQGNIYSWVAVFIVILTFGMETGFFRFVNKEHEKASQVYSISIISVLFFSIIFVVLGISFVHPISHLLKCPDHPEYILTLLIVTAIDSLCAIPYAYLRYKKKPIRFASIQTGTTLVIIFFTIFFYWLCPIIYAHHPSLISWFFSPMHDAAGNVILNTDHSMHIYPGYVYVANLIGVVCGLFALAPYFFGFKYTLDRVLLKKMFRYCFPLVIFGIAGILNQMLDKILFPFIFKGTEKEALSQLGIYTASSRIAVIMMMFTTAFRYAYEPFIFAKNKDTTDTKSYSDAMKYFIIIALFIFLGVVFYIDILKYYIGKSYFAGIGVVPIVLMGYIFFGIYFNLSFWYKMIDKTYFGAIFSVAGCVIILVLNVVFVPIYGYFACAWATLICNVLMVLLSYYYEQKYHPIVYDLKTIGLYFGLAIGLFTVSHLITINALLWRLLFRTILLLIFVGIALGRDFRFKQLSTNLLKKKKNIT